MLIRAAQYLRMSTESQRYSLINQAAAIAAFAMREGYEVVATYEDAGKSGLTFDKRDGLKLLLSDIVQRGADYDAVLVLDVSRWGRFQDPDQAAYYEFTCKAAGVDVRYVGEEFDFGPTGAILKQLKRVMAGEYSRELSVKVKQAKRRVQAAGLHQGGPCPLGVARQEIRPDGTIVRTLARGERKSRPENVLRYVHGDPDEIALVRRIFHLYLDRKLRPAEIARVLTSDGLCWLNEQPVTFQHVRRVLSSELVTGRLLVGKGEHDLGGSRRSFPRSEWRSTIVFEPIIPPTRFRAAERRRVWLRANRRVSDEALLARLRQVKASDGRVPSLKDVDVSKHCPSAGVYEKRFGSVGNALQLIGKERRTDRMGNPVGRYLTDDTLLEVLRTLAAQHGYVSATVLTNTPNAPSVQTYLSRFGSLFAAYARAGVASRDRKARIVQPWERAGSEPPPIS